MAKAPNPLAMFNTTGADRRAVWMPVGSAIFSAIGGGILLCRADYLIGLLGIGAAIASAAGIFATAEASRKRDDQLWFWIDSFIKESQQRSESY